MDCWKKMEWPSCMREIWGNERCLRTSFYLIRLGRPTIYAVKQQPTVYRQRKRGQRKQYGIVYSQNFFLHFVCKWPAVWGRFTSTQVSDLALGCWVAWRWRAYMLRFRRWYYAECLISPALSREKIAFCFTIWHNSRLGMNINYINYYQTITEWLVFFVNKGLAHKLLISHYPPPGPGENMV